MTDREGQETRFVSYSQNGEDVMLARALGDLETGFYVDVGAAWPRIDSVTKHFYDAGWSGINIEPNPALLGELQRERPRDVNLGVAIGSEPGTTDFFVVSDTGLSTLDPALAGRHEQNGYAVERIPVEIVPLADLLAEYAGDREIQFLKIDVEGAEYDVVHSNDWRRFRPWIVVAEVVTASSPDTSSSSSYEDYLAEQGYRAVHRDGINVFFLADEHSELASAFATPLNILDNFVSVEVVDLADVAQRLEAHIDWLSKQHEEQLEWLAVERERLDQDHQGRIEALRREREAEADELRRALDDAVLDALEHAAEADRYREENRGLRDQLSSARSAVAERALAAEQANEALRRVTSSQSWRLTRPLRVLQSLRLQPRATLRYLLHRATGGRISAVRPAPHPAATTAPEQAASGELAPRARDFLAVVDGAFEGGVPQ